MTTDSLFEIFIAAASPRPERIPSVSWSLDCLFQLLIPKAGRHWVRCGFSAAWTKLSCLGIHQKLRRTAYDGSYIGKSSKIAPVYP